MPRSGPRIAPSGLGAFAALIVLTLWGVPSACAAAPRGESAPRLTPDLSVRFIYLVSADRQVRPDFVAAITAAAKEVQQVYASQLGGASFRLTRPVVEVVHSDQSAAWFYAHDSGNGKDNWGYDNALAEVDRLLGVNRSGPYIWVIYSDGPGNSGRGGGQVAVMPEDDLLGLVGQHPTQKDPRRWVYGMAHELGHALGLPHPPDLDAVPNAIMGRGFYTCFDVPGSPDAGTANGCELTADDRATLRESRFILPPGAVVPVVDRRYGYARGTFTRYLPDAPDRPVRWVELAEGGVRFDFVEVAGEPPEPGTYHLRDRTRGYEILIPARGGTSRISADGGQSWRDLYPVTREAP